MAIAQSDRAVKPLNPYETLDIDGRAAFGQEQRRIRQYGRRG